MNPRTFLIALIMTLLLPVHAIQSAFSGWYPLEPGIDYRPFSLPGPVRVFVARMDRNNPNVTLESSLGSGMLGRGFEPVRGQSARYEDTLSYWPDLDQPGQGSWGKTSDVVVAINGSYVEEPAWKYPENGMVQSGWFIKRYTNYFGRSGFAWTLDREAFIGQCVFQDNSRQFVTFSNDGSKMEFAGMNRLLNEGETNPLLIYTPQFGGFTPSIPDSNATEVLVELQSPLLIIPTPQGVRGRVLRVNSNNGGTPIGFDQVVLVARGDRADDLAAKATEGEEILISQEITHKQDCQPDGAPLADWSETYTAIGGTHTFLKDSVVVTDPKDTVRRPHTAVAFNAQYVYFIVVDGRDARNSVGMTVAEIGAFARDTLQATDGILQDGGGSSTMVVNGRVVNNPSDVCRQLVYLPQVMNNSSGGTSSPYTPKPQPYPPSGITLDRCERPVPNGLMMVKLKPMAQSISLAAGDIVSPTTEINLRAGPGTNYSILMRIPYGTQGTVMDSVNGQNGVLATGYYWWKVDFNGAQGWVAETFLRKQ